MDGEKMGGEKENLKLILGYKTISKGKGEREKENKREEREKERLC